MMTGFGAMTGEYGSLKARRKLWLYPLPLIAFYSRRTLVVAHMRHPMDVVHNFSRRLHAQVTLILGTAKRETPEIATSEEEDRLLGCPR
jgi:hypothetical protein